MAATPFPRPPSPPSSAPRDGIGVQRAGGRPGFVRATVRATAVAVVSLALGTAAVLGLLFAAIALA